LFFGFGRVPPGKEYALSGKDAFHHSNANLVPSVSFICEFSPNFDLKNAFLTYTCEKWPKFARFWRFIYLYLNCQIFYDKFQKVAKNIEGFFIKKIPLLSYLVCNQIWLNYFMDNCHFGYITKSLKETQLLSLK
jgi:hypothetical protein